MKQLQPPLGRKAAKAFLLDVNSQVVSFTKLGLKVGATDPKRVARTAGARLIEDAINSGRFDPHAQKSLRQRLDVFTRS